MTRTEILDTLSDFHRNKGDEYHLRKLGLFGSSARDPVNLASDIDVVVELAEPDLLTLVGIKQDLEELLHRPVDIVRYRETMNPFLKRRIDRDAVYV